MTEAEVEESLSITNAAAEPPWFAEEITPDGLTIVDDGRSCGMYPFAAETFEAKFCAHARTALPEMAGMLQRAMGLIERAADLGCFLDTNPENVEQTEAVNLIQEWNGIDNK